MISYLSVTISGSPLPENRTNIQLNLYSLRMPFFIPNQEVKMFIFVIANKLNKSEVTYYILQKANSIVISVDVDIEQLRGTEHQEADNNGE